MFAVRRNLAILILTSLGWLGACAQTRTSPDTISDSIIWAQTAAEYRALSMQAYNAATATLAKAIADISWTALPDQENAAGLPIAVIFDVDETLVSNAGFQATFERPFENYKLDDWNRANMAVPVPGAVEFAATARAAGATLFFVTNRPCEQKDGIDDTCPQEKTTVQDLTEAGIEADSEHVMLAYERPEWGKEKVVRRNLIAETHRVIFLFGDDLGDFIACSRAKPAGPCNTGATQASRRAATINFEDYWGVRWYVLPNPMHGSWTSVR